MGMDGDIALRKSKEFTRVALENYTPSAGLIDAAITQNTFVTATADKADDAFTNAVTAQEAASSALEAAATAQGAVVNKVDKIPTVVRVDDYIPAGYDKVNQDTSTYWKAAISAAGSGGVIRYNGRYKIDYELPLLNFQSVVGDANFYGHGGGLGSGNCLDFRGLVADANGERVGFRLAAANVFRRGLFIGPAGPSFSDTAYGVSCVTTPSPVATSPRFERVQFYRWTRGANLYGAYYTSFDQCEWQYNTVGVYADACYNLKLVNPKMTCASIDNTSYGIGIEINGVCRSLTVLGGSIEFYQTAIKSSSHAVINLVGLYFETPMPPSGNGAWLVDPGDGAQRCVISMRGCLGYLLGHTGVIRFTHMVSSSLTAHSNTYLYNQISGDDSVSAPTVPSIYAVAAPGTGTYVDLKGDNTAACYRSSPNQTWGYTDNSLTQGVPAGYNIDFPYPGSWERRAAVSLQGRSVIRPHRVVTASSTLLDTDDTVLVNAPGATTQKLPTAANMIPGRTVQVRNIGTGTITVAPAEASGVTLTGPVTIAPGQAASYFLYGGNWFAWSGAGAVAAASDGLWRPRDNSMIGASGDPGVALAANQSAMVSGTQYLTRVKVDKDGAVTAANFFLATAATSLTEASLDVYDSTGARLGTCDITNQLTVLSGQFKTATLTAPTRAVVAGEVLYVGIRATFTGTAPVIRGLPVTSVPNANVSGGARVRFGTQGTGVSSPQASITVASIVPSAAGQQCHWVGLI